MKKLSYSFIILLTFLAAITIAQEKKSVESVKDVSLSGLKFRSIGPAVTGGRVRDIAVNPEDHSEYYIGVGDGSLWKTTNNGISWNPVFDNQGAYAIGAVRIDPQNTNVVWVGTGESSNHNNSGYGDGVYKSEDGGKSWNNVGLKESEHIGGIAIDPKNPNTVYVAAMGPQRRAGGERGIYKTTDGGKSWEHVLNISKYTGCYQVHIDSRYPNIVYAVAHQRMRKLYSAVWGGPESAFYRSTDYGKTWDKMTNGLPSSDIGRSGMTISPADPDVLYAIIEAKTGGGLYRSKDRGASWSKMSSYVSAYAFYFQKIYADPVEVDRLYSMDVFLKVSNDGGKSWENAGEKFKHVDNHCMWIDPDDNRHAVVGCDGGMYQTYDQCKNWDFLGNLPISEIYKVTTDNSKPFYNVYIGTQDNNSLGGPSRTVSSAGIVNADWYFTVSGDGFETQVDWKDPNIVYSQYQYGGLYRYDKKTSEILYIKPQDFADTAYRFDWDAALLISKHDNKTLYMGGHKLLKTTNQGSSWTEISGDLTRGVPKEIMKLMDRSWSKDDLARKGSMAIISSIAESPLDANILYVGSGDGLIHYTNDGGNTWQKSATPDDLPKYSRIHNMVASHHNKLVAYAATQNFLDGDFKPYMLKTVDGGKSWNYINGDLPERGSSYAIAEDHVNKDLLFCGTQFGVFFTNNGGKSWLRMGAGIPKMITMDLEIQKDENDLVVSTFGRGVYILDDYSPLRYMDKETLNKEAYIFPVKDALMFIESNPYGFPGVGFMGSDFYAAENPPVGAVFTYYVKDAHKSLEDIRRDREKELQKENKDVKFPDYNTLRAEGEEPSPFLLFTITDEEGNVVRKIKKGISKGVQRVVWDFRHSVPKPVSLTPFDDSIPWAEPDLGYMAVPGKYYVSLSKFVDGNFTELVAKQPFECKTLNSATIPVEDYASLKVFNKKVHELTRAITAMNAYRGSLDKKISYFKKAFVETAEVQGTLYNRILELELKLDKFNRELNGDGLRSYYEGGTPTTVSGRVELITYALWSTTSAQTETFKKSYEVAAASYDKLEADLKKLDNEVKSIEAELDKLGTSYTPGRFPNWRK